ncbi:MAG: hypothetical protein KKA81_09085 [Bacteroidetes bacterium]|nr:hypothetical protein [Bacteroidota bacterium]
MSASQIVDAFITSVGQTGYLINYMGSNAYITKMLIDGVSSAIQDQASVNCSFTSAGGTVVQHSTSALSPDDQYLLFGYEDPILGSVLNIVDAQTMELLTSVPVPESEIYGYAFTGDSKRVITLGQNLQVPIIFLDGENSYMEHKFDIYPGSYSGSYNPIDGLFYVLGDHYYMYKVDPFTGEILETIDMDIPGSTNYRVAIDQQGVPLVLTSSSMEYDGISYPMPGISSELIYNQDYDLFISPVPGPDVICVFNPLQVGIQTYYPGKESDVFVFPNPAKDMVSIRSAGKIKGNINL